MRPSYMKCELCKHDEAGKGKNLCLVCQEAMVRLGEAVLEIRKQSLRVNSAKQFSPVASTRVMPAEFNEDFLNQSGAIAAVIVALAGHTGSQGCLVGGPSFH